jgi:catechol 2,3-dioxygenase-like lactoylglutathione lyase family enzyme
MATITGISHIDLTVTDLDRSEEWYSELLGMKRVLDGRNDAQHFESRYLRHPDTMLILGLVHHDGANGSTFDEHRVGLDHLSFNVPSRADLDAWQARLAERAIEHAPIAEAEMWDVLVVRDPDNIQLEFFYMKPAAATLLE